MLKKRNKFVDADNAFVLTGTILVVLVIVVGGFLFMAYAVSQIVNIGMAIAVMGVGILALGAGVMLLRRGLTGVFPTRGK